MGFMLQIFLHLSTVASSKEIIGRCELSNLVNPLDEVRDSRISS